MGSQIQAIAFSPDGSIIACGALNGQLRLFQMENGQRLSQIKDTHGPIFALGFTPDGKQIAAGGYDGRIRFYNTASGEVVKEFDNVTIDSEKVVKKGSTNN
jgi:WD40 repeat protein